MNAAPPDPTNPYSAPEPAYQPRSAGDPYAATQRRTTGEASTGQTSTDRAPADAASVGQSWSEGPSDLAYSTHPAVFGYVAWCFGIFGAHRFYFGRPLSGLIYLLTFGLFLVGWIIDLFTIPVMADAADRRYAAGECDYTIGWLLLTFLGIFGVHRFYMQKFGTGLVYLLTGGLLGIGIIYDFATLNEQIDEINRGAV